MHMHDREQEKDKLIAEGFLIIICAHIYNLHAMDKMHEWTVKY